MDWVWAGGLIWLGLVDYWKLTWDWTWGCWIVAGWGFNVVCLPYTLLVGVRFPWITTGWVFLAWIFWLVWYESSTFLAGIACCCCWAAPLLNPKLSSTFSWNLLYNKSTNSGSFLSYLILEAYYKLPPLPTYSINSFLINLLNPTL